MRAPAQTAQCYIDAMNAAEIEEMMSLFAQDAVLRHISGTYTDPEAIRSFFVEIAFGNAAHLQPVDLTTDSSTAWLEVEATSSLTPGRQRVVDVFRVDDQGRIRDLGIYSGNVVPNSEG